MDTKSSNIIFLDVATRYTGYAIFNCKLEVPPRAIFDGGLEAVLIQIGLLRGRGTKTNVYDRGQQIARQVRKLLLEFNIKRVVLEFPSPQGGTRGIIAARTGVLSKLGWLCGAIEGVAANINKADIPCEKVYFITWNGQTPKHITCNRFREIFDLPVNPRSIANNYVDAAMMGVWWLRKHGISLAPAEEHRPKIDI